MHSAKRTAAAILLCTAAGAAGAAPSAARPAHDYPIQPVAITNVSVTGGFWLPRFETNRLVTIKSDFANCEKARIPNFVNAAKREWGVFKGIPFDDSDVYKVIEGAAYSLAIHPDPELKAYVDRLAGWIAKAQEPDGYLYTARTLGYDIKKGRHRWMMGATRWSHLDHSHELYNVGHLYEAAVAYWQATGERTLLDVAVRSADLVDRTFGPAPTQLKGTSGHEEIELALCKLYRATGEERYLKLAKHLLDMRGRKAGADGKGKVFNQSGAVEDSHSINARAYCQNHMPVTKQREAVGHSVRAVYLYCGMADVAALTGDDAYVEAIDAIWENVASKKLHLNGSVGASPRGEAFGANYELPNENAYLETCAGIGYALWNQRMFMRYGDAKYIDLLERGIYNGILSGVSLSGDEFFYPNPLATRGGYKRSKWFACSCCPVNIVRFIPQIAQFAYATRGDDAYVNLFVESEATLSLACGRVKLAQKTEYPWSGSVRIEVAPEKDGAKFALDVRVPGWCVGRPVPSDLYVQTEPGTPDCFRVKVNGRPFAFSPRKGYCRIEREWKAGDAVELEMDMPVRRIKAHDAVKADAGRLAVERGPVLYCAEGVDNGGRVFGKSIAPDAKFSLAQCDILGNVYPALDVPAALSKRDLDGTVRGEPCTLRLVPYFAWCHRGAGELQTWFPVAPSAEDAASPYKIAVSHCFPKDSVSAIADGVLPKASNDTKIRRHTFWDRKGTDEWVEVSFDSPAKAKGLEIYWFDDGDDGLCRVPASWKVQWRPSADAAWRDICPAGETAKDRFCAAVFPREVEAQAFRIDIKLQEGFSAGILELRARR